MYITHLAHRSRASLGISQGTKYFGVERSDLSDLKKSDVIILADSVDSRVIEILDSNNLWHKVYHYDYRDTTIVERDIAKKCVRSFKRSVIDRGNNNQFIKDYNLVEYICHCALDEYYLQPVKPIYDIGCFFDLKDPDHLGFRRLNLVSTLDSLKIENSLIGYSTGKKQHARLMIFSEDKNNFFYDFLKLQSKCKIIFSAQPSHCEGDNRTWEALASGNLVFLDKTFAPLENPLIDGQHCFYYDATSKDSILEAYEKALYYLKNDELRLKIAREGYEFTLKYHRPKNRCEQILRHIKGRKLFL